MTKSNTVFETANKYGFSTRYVRLLIERGKIKARKASTNPSSKIWLIDPDSVKAYLKSKPKPGRPKSIKNKY